MPIWLIKEKNGMPAIEIVWHYEEWCKEVPRVWVDNCGCRRCCSFDTVREFVTERVARELSEYKLSYWFKQLGKNFWWILRLYDNGMVCLTPWPRKLVKSLSSFFGR